LRFLSFASFACHNEFGFTHAVGISIFLSFLEPRSILLLMYRTVCTSTKIWTFGLFPGFSVLKKASTDVHIQLLGTLTSYFFW
jgi:hypothetical protein